MSVGQGQEFGCVLVYRYTKEGNINELRHNSMYGYENKRNSLVYRYTRTAPRVSKADKGPTRKSSALERYRVLERISWVDNVNWLL